MLFPLLWCLVFDDLIDRLNMGGVYTQGYADLFSAVGKFPNTVSAHAVETMCGEIGFSVHFGKTELVFRRRRKLPGFFEPPLFGVTVALVYSYFGQISPGSPGFSADLEGECEYQLEEGSQFSVGL